jgi:NAD(P)-dependent dehydrogenase (short-subunit alcohol dehydrogenase family)
MRPDAAAPVALVTGATGGLGRHIALRLAKDGYRLLLQGRDVVRLAELSAEVRAAGGPSPQVIRADFRDLENVAALCETVERTTGRLDLVLNNAGTGFQYEPDLTSGGDSIAPTFQVNYLAPYLIMHRLLPLMRGVEGSAIVNIASLGQADLPEDLRQARRGPDAIVYGRSKLALIMATRSLAERLGEGPPAVYALHPGSMLDTGLTRALLERMPPWVGLCWRASRRLRPTVDRAAGFVVAVAAERPRTRPSGTFWTAKKLGRARPQAAIAIVREELEAFSRDAVAPFFGGTSEDSNRSRAQATLIEASSQ